MDDPAVTEYLGRKAWKSKRQGKQITTDCPFCQRPEKWSINAETGLWHCWHAECGERGNLWQLKKQLGDLVDAAPIDGKYRPYPVPSEVTKRPPEGCDEEMHRALFSDTGKEALEWLTVGRWFTVD